MFDSDTYSGPKYGPNNSNSSISTSSLLNELDEEPSAKIKFNPEYYDNRNGSPTNENDNSPTNEKDIDIGIGGKRKTKKRKYKKII